MHKPFKNQVNIFFDQKCIRFVHCTKADAGNNSIHMRGKPAWQEIMSFIEGKHQLLVFSDDRPEMLFRHFVTFFNGIEAAGGLLKNLSGQWLFIFRNGRWDLPKGIIQKNEHREHAAIREVQEECGISEIKITNSLPFTYHIYPGQKNEWMLKKTHWFLMSAQDDSSVKPQTEEGITKVEWRHPDAIDDILQNTYGNIRKLLDLCKQNNTAINF